LTNFAVEYGNADFIASRVAPFVPVVHKSDEYYTFTKKDKFTIPEDIRGPKSEANEVDWSSSTDTYACIDRALRDFLADSIVGNADPVVNPRQRTTNFLVDLLLLAHERRVAASVFATGSYGASYRTALSGGDQLDKYATSDPLGVIETGREACFRPPNICVLGAEVYSKLKHHPAIIDKVKGGATVDKAAMVNTRLLAELFEVDEVLVGRAKYNSANKGATASYSYVWGKYIFLGYCPQSVSIDDVAAWKTFRWIQMSTNLPYKVRTYRDEARGGGGEWIEPEMSLVHKQVCADVGYLISGAVA
jgi:hypothetical protein